MRLVLNSRVIVENLITKLRESLQGLKHTLRCISNIYAFDGHFVYDLYACLGRKLSGDVLHYLFCYYYHYF